MLTLQEYLLTHLIEELSEVQKAVTKAQRFGPEYFWAKEGKINIDAIRAELLDVKYMVKALNMAGLHIDIDTPMSNDEHLSRAAKWTNMLHISRQLGRVHTEYDCRVCGKPCPITNVDPRIGAVCEEHCLQHHYETGNGDLDNHCTICFGLISPDDIHATQE